MDTLAFSKMKQLSLSTMNYLFLKTATGAFEGTYKTRLNEVVLEELSVYLGVFANMTAMPEELREIILTELVEGSYLDSQAADDLFDDVARAIELCLGEFNENIYNHYTYLIGEAEEIRNNQ